MVRNQSGKPIKQELFSAGVDSLNPRVTLLTTDKQVNRQNVLVCELRFRIIAISLTVAI